MVVGESEERAKKDVEGGVRAGRRSHGGGKDEVKGFKEGVKVRE